MDQERWPQVKEILNAAIQRPPHERPAFLARACSDDAALRSEVESLLDSYESAFLEQPVGADFVDESSVTQPQLTAGLTVGHYQILSLLGKGGMGEVYLAQDTRLRRKVALKRLPARFTLDEERVRRFELEARAASALNHPNIVTIYEIGNSNSLHFITAEFIDGKTLRHHLTSGRMKIDEVLDIATQIAAALMAAHAAGIVHRDIKPENVMLRSDRIVKVLDFGLAKLAFEEWAVDAAATGSMVKTNPGMVMGTVQYMSPEQLRGSDVDARTDIWSFGVVLFEMVTGCVPFVGETPIHVGVSVMESVPVALATFSETPPELERIITKALQKDREERYQTAGDLALDLKSLKEELELRSRLKRVGPREAGRREKATKSEAHAPLTRATPHQRLSLPKVLVVTGAIGLFVIIALLLWKDLAKPPSLETTRVLSTTQITTWQGLDLTPSFSPDGSSVTYSSDHGGSFEIYIKSLSPGATEVQVTADGGQNFQPDWSPDGKWIAYCSRKRGGIWRVPASGGVPQQLTQFGSNPAWSPDSSRIAFESSPVRDISATSIGALPPSTLWLAPAQGGATTQITQNGTPRGGHGSASWSPDGKRIVFIAYIGASVEMWTVSVEGNDLKKVLARVALYDPVYAPDGEHIYFGGYSATGNFVLCKLAVSRTSGEAIGEPVEITDTGLARIKNLSISVDGKKIAYSAPTMMGTIMSIPLSPATNKTTGTPESLTQSTSYRKAFPMFSPDGQKISFVDMHGGANQDIWLMDKNGKEPTQLTTNPATDRGSSWFPDNDRIAFLSNRQGKERLWSISIKTGRENLLVDVGQDISWPRLSPDGTQVAFNSTKGGTINIWTVPVQGGEPKQITFDKESMGFPSWSADGRFLALQMNRAEDTHVGIIPSNGGETMQLTFDRGQSQVSSFSPDGDKIAFAGERNGVWNIWCVSRTTKTENQLTNYTKFNTVVRYPAWSSKGNQIVYEYSETTGNIWIMELK